MSTTITSEKRAPDFQEAENIPTKSSHRKRLGDLIKSYKEFESEEALHWYYLAYEGPEGGGAGDADPV